MSGILHFLQKQRTVVAAATLTTTGIGVWASHLTLSDNWDDVFPPPSVGNKDGTKEKVVILGSGWAGLNALRKCAGPNKDVVIVSPRPHFLYTPLLAGTAVGTVTLRSACEPIRQLITNLASSSKSSVTYVRADARDVDLSNKRVLATTAAGEDGLELELEYDKLIVAIGSEVNTFGTPGVKEHGLFLKEAEDSSRLHAKLVSNLERAAGLIRYGNKVDAASTAKNKYDDEIDRLLTFVVVGAGPTGVELSAELADFRSKDVARLFGEDVAARIKIVLVEAMPRILGPFDANLSKAALEHLEKRGIDVKTGYLVTKVEEGSAVLQPSTPRTATAEEKETAKSLAKSHDIGALVWTGGVKARPLVRELAKALGQTDLRGLDVDSSLRVKGADGVYAVGDAALAGYAPTAQVAENEGKHVGRCVRDGIDKPFVYGHKGSLVNLGEGNGIAQLVAPSSSALKIWDALGAPKASETVGPNKEKVEEIAITGPVAWGLWRSLYWTKLLSNESRFGLSLDWFKATFAGRNVVEPVLKRKDTLILPAKWKAGVGGGMTSAEGKAEGNNSNVESFGTPLQRNSTVASLGRREAPTDDDKGNKKKRFGLF